MPEKDVWTLGLWGVLRLTSQSKRACALLMVTAVFAAARGQVASADEVYTANPKPPTDGRVGANYTPAYAVNQVQFWHDFRPEVVDRELAAAREHFGISTLRVYLCWELMVGNSDCRCHPSYCFVSALYLAPRSQLEKLPDRSPGIGGVASHSKSYSLAARSP